MCDYFLDVNSTVCCNHQKIGFKYDNNRLSKIYLLSKKCKKVEVAEVSEFYGPITEEHIIKFEKIYKDTSMSVVDLMKKHHIHNQKWGMMAKEIKKRTGYIRPRHDSRKHSRYICKRKGAKQTYYMIKHNNKHFGSYKSFEDALIVRDILELCEWDKKSLPLIQSKLEEYHKSMDCGL